MPSNTVRGPDEAVLRQQCRAHAGLRRPAGMHALGPGALGEILDDAARHAAGDAERIDDLAAIERSAAATPAAAAMAPNTAVGWKPALCTSLGATRLSRHMVSTPTAMPSSADGAVRMVALAGREHRRHDDGAGVHRPALERVVEILAVRGGAVDQRGAGRAQRAGMADRGAGAIVVAAGERRLDVVLVARGEAETDHVDQQVLALRSQAAGRRAA